jgi:hypothetical protein
MSSVRVVLFLGIAVLTWAVAAHGVVDVSLGVSGVGMEYVNAQLALYGQEHRESISEIRLAWGGDATVEAPFSILGLRPNLGGRALLAGTSSEGGPITSSLLGVFAGAAYRLGGWAIGADVGVYRGAFSFERGGYAGLGGWGVGAAATAGYGLRLGTKMLIGLRVRIQWLPVGELTDDGGAVYAGREGPFLDYSGIGAALGVSW